MGSNYFGEAINDGNERSISSRRGSKKNGSDKPKQPQRGLGVAQLEKIRLSSQLECNYLPAPVHTPYAPHNFIQEDMRLQTSYCSSSSSPSNYGFSGSYGATMGFQEFDQRANMIRYAKFHSNTTVESRRQTGYENQHFVYPSMTGSFLDSSVEGSVDTMNKKDRNDGLITFNIYNNQHSDSTNSQDIDLELRL